MEDMMNKTEIEARALLSKGAIIERLSAAEARATELEAQLAGAASVVVTLTKERDEWRNTIQRLTPLGSEYTTPLECAAYIESKIVNAPRRIIELTTERDKATNIAAELLRRLEDAQARVGQLEAERDEQREAARLSFKHRKQAETERDEWVATAVNQHAHRELERKDFIRRLHVVTHLWFEAKHERDAAQLELQQIRTMLDDGTSDNDNSALALVKRLQAHDYAMQREKWYERM